MAVLAVLAVLAAGAQLTLRMLHARRAVPQPASRRISLKTGGACPNSAGFPTPRRPSSGFIRGLETALLAPHPHPTPPSPEQRRP